MDSLLYSLISAAIVSLISLIGIIFLALKIRTQKIVEILVGFATGALFGDAFLHLLPESIEKLDSTFGRILILIGIFLFFILEEFICWRHCHLETSGSHPHPVAFMNLIGDALHNFFDGLAIGVSFLTNFSLGITTTLAIIFHEIPQEIGDFGVLVYAGLSQKKAIFLNLLTALTAVLGAVLPFVLKLNFGQLNIFLPIISGGFIYIAGSDLVPLIKNQDKNQKSLKKSFVFLLAMILGAALMYLLLLCE